MMAVNKCNPNFMSFLSSPSKTKGKKTSDPQDSIVATHNYKSGLCSHVSVSTLPRFVAKGNV